LARWLTNPLPEAGTAASPAPAHPPALAAVSSNPALLRLAHAKRVLLLQGPVGPFFDRLTRWLRTQGAEVHRVVFHPGDKRDCQALTPIAYSGGHDEWPAFLDELIQRLGIDTLVLFGQARRLHALAIAQANARGLAVVVTEEGYVRPGYMTMELGGVNGFSNTLQRYQWVPVSPGPRVQTQRPAPSDHHFRQMAWFACRHYWHLHWGQPLSAHYQHHRPTDVVHHSRYWVTSWLKKHWRWLPDHARVKALADQPYYFVPLQHDGDSQITHHSRFDNTTDFLVEVVTSFARHAPAHTRLVVRQHPHARGGRGPARFLRELTRQLGVQDRVVYLVEGHTPTLVTNARGVVVINSTVGLQALMRNKPLAVLGDALYKQPKLCFSGPLDDFWASTPPPSPEHTHHFIEQLIALTQVPCHVYGLASEPLHWSVQTHPAP